MASGKLPRMFLCFELEEGALLIGYVGFVSCILTIAQSISKLSMYSNTLQQKQISLIIFVFGVILSPLYVALIYGTKKQNHKFLLPWLIIHGILLIFATAFVPISIIATIANINNKYRFKDYNGTIALSAGDAAVFCVVAIFGYAFALHIYMTVGAFYKKLRDGNERTNTVYVR